MFRFPSKVGASISCYTCSSRNNSDSYCADPFHPAMSKYIENCKVPKQNHIGVFPARFCVKVIGKTVTNGEELVIRACSLENMDNQCGNFKFEKDTLKGRPSSEKLVLVHRLRLVRMADSVVHFTTISAYATILVT
ncbi:unnamed protein product [Oppiella nova]|uniref:Protein sleepless n=1 Tax=Oppiella nova TaxID=334625 RepID=A0A7R9LYS5_9ACAR|nr:unnamed protein product [Oppiella nova]CAG2167641.1 unnamed protein product [Oppiella nova]